MLSLLIIFPAFCIQILQHYRPRVTITHEPQSLDQLFFIKIFVGNMATKQRMYKLKKTCKLVEFL